MTIPPVNYEPNIPLPKDIFSSSQPQFLQNFKEFYDAFALNHVPLDAATLAGNHNTIELFEQTSQFQTNAGEVSVYGKEFNDMATQLFMRFQGNQTEFPFSNYQIYPIKDILSGNTVIQKSFISFLPGNLLVYFGEVSGVEIVLNPVVCKNILGVNLCWKDTPENVPYLDVEFNVDKNATRMVLTAGQLAALNHYYFILGNL